MWMASLCACALSASAALAQRGIAGPTGSGQHRGAGISRDPGVSVPRLVNGVNLVVEHRQELALTDTQFVRVIGIKRALDSANAPLMRRIDSVQRLFKGGSLVFGNPGRAHRDSVAEAHAVIAETQAGVRQNIAEWRDKAWALLAPKQAAIAEELEAKAERALADDARGKGRGG